MAQKRFWNWKDDDYTLDLNHRELGILESGLYRGFDRHSSSAGLNLVLHHGVNGIKKVKLDTTETNSMGVWMSKQGCVITEDGNITIPISANTTSNPRIDLIIGTHQYSQTQGGLVATYSVIQGTPSATPVEPSLTQPTLQIILGKLNVPANTSSISGMTYTKSKMPNLGNAPDIAMSLTDLLDVTITNATNGDILVKNGSGDWMNINAKNFIQTLQLNMSERFGFNYSQQTLAYMSGGSPVMGLVDDVVGVTGGYAFNFGANVIHWDVGDGVFSAYQIPNLWGASAVKWGADHPSGTIIYMIISPNIGMNIQFGASGAPAGYCPFISNSKSGISSFGATCLKFTKYSHKLSGVLGFQNYWLVEEVKDYDSYITSLQDQIIDEIANRQAADQYLQDQIDQIYQTELPLYAQRDSANLPIASQVVSPTAYITKWRDKLMRKGLMPRATFHAEFLSGDIGNTQSVASWSYDGWNVSNIQRVSPNLSGCTGFIITLINPIPASPNTNPTSPNFEVHNDNVIVTFGMNAGQSNQRPDPIFHIKKQSSNQFYLQINEFIGGNVQDYTIKITGYYFAVG